MNPIGGYFELELLYGEEYHKNAIRLNTGRNAFEYILRAKRYKKVFLPYYTCDVMLEPVHKLKLNYEFYHIDQAFSPKFDFINIKQDEVFVYNNYFGICDKQVNKVAKKCKNLIIDNSQAFYSKPLPGIDTFYSPRKFFGVPDGAYLYTDKKLKIKFEQDISYKRFEHLLGRIDINAEKFYSSSKKNDDSLIGQPIMKMSNLTRRLLQGIDYKTIAQKRRDNFLYFQEKFNNSNQLEFFISQNSVPMVYPYLIRNGNILKQKLINNKIFVATYWPNVSKWCNPNMLEYNLMLNLLPLPIDQRYNKNDLTKIVELI